MHEGKRSFHLATTPTVEFAAGEHGNFAGAMLPMKECSPNPEDFPVGRQAAMLRWLNSPVVWTLIVLILSTLGIFRELL